MANTKIKKHEFKPHNYDGVKHEAPDCFRMIVRHKGRRRYVFMWQNFSMGQWQAWEETENDQDMSGRSHWYVSKASAMKSIIKMYDAGRHFKRDYELAYASGASSMYMQSSDR